MQDTEQTAAQKQALIQDFSKKNIFSNTRWLEHVQNSVRMLSVFLSHGSSCICCKDVDSADTVSSNSSPPTVQLVDAQKRWPFTNCLCNLVVKIGLQHQVLRQKPKWFRRAKDLLFGVVGAFLIYVKTYITYLKMQYFVNVENNKKLNKVTQLSISTPVVHACFLKVLCSQSSQPHLSLSAA